MVNPTSVEQLPNTPEEAGTAVGEVASSLLHDAVRWMILARAFDARMQGLQRQGRIGFYGAATGQEAVNVAAGLVSRPEDWIFPGLREQWVAVVRGYSLESYAHSIFADDRDVARGRQMPCHPSAREVHYVSMSSVIGTQISQAVGLAYAIRRRGDPGVVYAFFGDGATSSNDFHAALNFAAVLHLPVVFVCANNQWAISVPVSRQTAASTMAAKASAYGLPGVRVDGTDFFAVHRALRETTAAVRSGSGPALIEFLTFRMTPHSTSDDPSRYQPSEWAIRAARNDPVLRLGGWMRTHDLLSDDSESAMQRECDEQVRAAVAAAESAPPPAVDSLTEDVYSARGSPSRPTVR